MMTHEPQPIPDSNPAKIFDLLEIYIANNKITFFLTFYVLSILGKQQRNSETGFYL